MNHTFQNLIIQLVIQLLIQQHNIQQFGKYVIFKDFSESSQGGGHRTFCSNTRNGFVIIQKWVISYTRGKPTKFAPSPKPAP
jgi:hypothetical protein